MKYIMLTAVIVILALQLTGGIPQSSVGGPLTLGFVLIVAALAVGAHEAWTAKRGPLGWIINLPVSLIGAVLAASIFSVGMETMLMYVNLDGSLIATGNPLLYLLLAGTTLITLCGSNVALSIINRFR